MKNTENRDAVMKKYGQLEGICESYEGRFTEWHACLEGESAESALEQFELSKLNRAEFSKRITEWIEETKSRDGSRGHEAERR